MKLFFIISALIICSYIAEAQKEVVDSLEVKKLSKIFSDAEKLFDQGNFSASKKAYKKIINIGSEKEFLILKYKSLRKLGKLSERLQLIDSSSYYYSLALKALDNSNETLENKFFQKAELKNYLSLNEFNTGQMEKSITTMEAALYNAQQFINYVKSDELKRKGVINKLKYIDNLGGFYRGLGENEKGISLIKYSYEQKLKKTPNNKIGLLYSEAILSHFLLINREYKEALKYSDKAFEKINLVSSLKAYLYLVRASIYENLKDYDNAKKFYIKTEEAYRKEVVNNSYNVFFLDALNEMSLFYLKISETEKSLSLAKEAYEQVKRKNYTNNLYKSITIKNMAHSHFIAKKYKEAVKYSEEAIEIMNSPFNSRLDSIRNLFRKPIALYFLAKSDYLLNKHKSNDYEKQKQLIDEALSILSTNSSLFTSFSDLETLIFDHNELIEFRKLLLLEQFNKTSNSKLLNELLQTHEAAIYSRIRARLSVKNKSKYSSSIPKAIFEREQLLKKQLTSSIDGNKGLSEFFTVQNQWQQFKDSLAISYPKYYNLRYASIGVSMEDLQLQIPDRTTVIRYMYIDDDLYSYIITKNNKEFIKLPNHNIDSLIRNDSINITPNYRKHHTLYKKLWQPFEDKIITKNVIIIPDGKLFNISFETLTPKPITQSIEFANHSLLSKYNISYNYSLLLIDEKEDVNFFDNNFIGFTPEFDDTMKANYSISISDSIYLDKSYLKLLPQPFAKDLANQYTRVFSGKTYSNDNASKQLFINNAKEHKIIHIGTHAESNNVSPELSRLIFAKNIADSTSINDNYLYTYEIYDKNLTSNLTVLTACETGKPTYQPGEGMISLAHAFNYAGSESILTSLWKIDEQSSNTILSYFYDNLKNGLAKDDALRKAKLKYIQSAEGRTKAPQYWAGLVLIGDASPIELNSTSFSFIYLILGILLFMSMIVFIKKRGRL